MIKQIVLRLEEKPDPETIRAIREGKFSLELVPPKPIPMIEHITMEDGSIRERVFGYKPNPAPPALVLTVGVGEGRDKKLRDAAIAAIESLVGYTREAIPPEVDKALRDLASVVWPGEAEGEKRFPPGS